MDNVTFTALPSVTPDRPLGKIASALAKAQLEIEGAKRDSENPYFKSQYADLAAVWDACHKHLNAKDIAIVQTLKGGDGSVTVETKLIHSSGEWIDSTITLRPKTNDPQGIGSAITYARRYALAAITGVCPVDDDANFTSGKTSAKRLDIQSTTLQEIDALKNTLKITLDDLNEIAKKTYGTSVNELTDSEGKSLVTTLKRRVEAKAIAKRV